jgi:hypothetical protein
VARLAWHIVVQRDAWDGDSALNVDRLADAFLGAGMTEKQLDLVPKVSSPDEFDALPADEKMKTLRWKSVFIGVEGSMVKVETDVKPEDVLAPEELGKAAAEMLFKNGDPESFGVLKRDGEVYGYRFEAGDKPVLGVASRAATGCFLNQASTFSLTFAAGAQRGSFTPSSARSASLTARCRSPPRRQSTSASINWASAWSVSSMDDVAGTLAARSSKGSASPG